MKSFFLKPIGNLRDLGTAWKWRCRWWIACRNLGPAWQWLMDAVGVAILLATIVLAWFVLSDS